MLKYNPKALNPVSFGLDQALLQCAILATLSLAATIAATQVHAQENDGRPDTKAGDQLAEVIVTGTSIKREDSAALPITAVSADQMALRDATDAASLLTALPSVVNVPINDSSTGSAGARGDIGSVALRGLGSGNTLVLLNGRRVAPNAITSTEGGVPSLSVNVNVLPTLGLDRIDVLRDGASSLYGSDAVAGVINFVTDNKFVGTQAQVQSRLTEIGSGNEVGINVKHGADLMDGRLHWTSLFNIFYRQETYSSDVAYGESADRSSLAPGAWSTVAAFNGRTTASGFTQFTFGLPGASKTTYYVVPLGNGMSTITSSPTAAQKYAATYDPNPVTYDKPQSNRISWFNALDFRLNDKTTLYTEISLYRAESKLRRSPLGYGSGADTPAVLPANNPYNPFGQTITLTSLRFIDDGPDDVHDDSDFARWVGGIRGEIAGSWTYDTALMYTIDHVVDTQVNAVRESLWEQGALAQTNPSKAYNPFYYTFTGSGTNLIGTPYTNPQSVLSSYIQGFHNEGKDSIASWDGHVNGELFSLPAGAIQLAVGSEFRYESLAMTRPLYAGLNCLGDDCPSPGTVTLSANGYQGNILSPQGYILKAENNDFINASANGNVIGDRTVAAAFAETVIPLFSQKNALPGLQELSLSAAARYEHYSDFGNTTNPKYSLSWRPESHVMLRASYEHGFRAPNLAALGTPTRSTVGPETDTYYSGIPGVGAADGNAQRYSTTGVNTVLTPERSKSGSFGVVVDVPAVNGLSFSADYWQIDQVDLIATPSSSIVTAAENAGLAAATKALQAQGNPLAAITPQMLAAQLGYSGCFANPLTGADTYISYHDSATGATIWRTCAVDPQTAAAAVAAGKAAVGSLYNTFLPYANLSSATIDGIDFNITYKSPLSTWGRFQVVSDATLLDKFQRRATDISPLEHDIGRDGAARWRADLNVLWYWREWSAGAAAYYIGSYASGTQLPTSIPLSAVPAWSVYNIDGINFFRVASSITENVFVQYTVAPERKYLRNTSFRLGIDNLTNRPPPLTPGGYDPSVYSAIAMGRVWSLSITKSL